VQIGDQGHLYASSSSSGSGSSESSSAAADNGASSSGAAVVFIENTHKAGGGALVVHQGRVESGDLHVGQMVINPSPFLPSCESLCSTFSSCVGTGACSVAVSWCDSVM
jgi:hypothetical protein